MITATNLSWILHGLIYMGSFSIFVSKSGLELTIPPALLILFYLKLRGHWNLNPPSTALLGLWVVLLGIALFSSSPWENLWGVIRDGKFLGLGMIGAYLSSEDKKMIRQRALQAMTLGAMVALIYSWWQFYDRFGMSYSERIRNESFWDFLRWGVFVGFLWIGAVFLLLQGRLINLLAFFVSKILNALSLNFRSKFLSNVFFNLIQGLSQEVRKNFDWRIQGGISRTLASVLSMIIILGLIGSPFVWNNSRGPWLGALMSVLVFITLMPAHKKWGVALLLVISVFLMISPSFQKKWFSSFAISVDREGRWNSSDGSNQGRLFMWQIGLELWKQKPWLGVGYDQLHSSLRSFKEMRSELWERFATSEYSFNDLHSSWFSFLVRQGLVGLLAFAATWIFLIGFWWKRLRDEKSYAIFCLGLLTYHSVISLFADHVLSYEMTTLYPWLAFLPPKSQTSGIPKETTAK